MARLSMSELTTLRWSFEEDVALYAACQIPAIGVWREKLTDFGEEKGIELLQDHGLEVCSLSWAGGFTGSEGMTFRDSVNDAAEALRLAESLGAPCLIVHSGPRNGHTQGHARRLLLQGLRELAPLAAECGVVLGLEPMPPESAVDWTFLTDLGEAESVVDEVDSPQVGLVINTYHWGWVSQALDQAAALAPRICLVKLGDSRRPPDRDHNRCRLGEGAVPLGAWVSRLVAAGFDGDFDVELRGDDLGPCQYESVLRHSKHAFERLVGQAVA
jgi:sugar phosphate isomerase/epimerase